MKGLKLRRSDWLDQLTIYLPVMLMGLLALGTYWLLRSMPALSVPEAARPATHNADYFMQQFSVKTFDAQGLLKTELLGREMRHFPDTDTLEIDLVNLRSYDNQGRMTVATALRGLSNGDGSEVQLMGNAVVTRDAALNVSGKMDPKMEVRSEFLHLISDTEHIKTHLPVRIVRGDDDFRADSMDYDNVNHVADLQGRVKGVLFPTVQLAPKPAPAPRTAPPAPLLPAVGHQMAR